MFIVLYDNYRGSEQLRTGWGFSCLVRGFEKTVLFDTGADGDILLHNMSRLQVDPAEVDAIVLSHDHWDHTGGLEAFVQRNARVTVCMPESFSGELKKTAGDCGAEITESAGAVEICPRISTTPVLGDAIPERALCVRAGEGPVVITGCAHPGIVEMVEAAQEVVGETVHAAFGGFHLKDAWGTELNSTIARLKDLGVQRVGPCHCSGDEARRKMSEVFGESYIALNVGTEFSL